MYDIIGDIHGYADQLEALLKKMNYKKTNGSYRHPERKVIFVGDFIDRGPEIRETLQIVKAMTDGGNALAVMGNHEYNALCYFTKDEHGKFLRPHIEKNMSQVIETEKQFHGRTAEWNFYLDWFRKLPPFLELDGIRIVHAFWDDSHIKLLRNSKIVFDTESLIELHKNREGNLYVAINETLKGKEERLPSNGFFQDKSGSLRYNSRVKWWLDPAKCTYGEYYFDAPDSCANERVDHSNKAPSFYDGSLPVIFGHYWMRGPDPKIQTGKVACVDYSIADNNILCAYRWNGEKGLSDKGFEWVG